MATAATNQIVEEKTPSAGVVTPFCPPGQATSNSCSDLPSDSQREAPQHNSLQRLIEFSALHERVRRRRSLESRRTADNFTVPEAGSEDEDEEQFTVDEVLQLVAERAVAVTGADGLAIALAENNEIVLRAAAGTVRPGVGARIDRDSTFSGACFRTAQVVSCDDTEADPRVNLQACRSLGARSMIAVPLCGRRPIGLLQAFSAQPFGFDDNDARNLNKMAELVLGALTPEDEERFGESALVAATKLEAARSEPQAVPVAELDKPADEPHANHRRGRLVLLLCVVIASALAAGIAWKLKPWHLANKMVRMQVTLPKPIDTAATSAPVAPSVSMTDIPANTAPRATSKGGQAANLPERRASSNFPMVTAIEHSSSADSSTVILSLDDRAHYDAHRLANPDRIYFDLHNTVPASDLAWKTFEVGDPLLKCIRVAQPASGVTRVVLETNTRADFSVNLQPNPYRLVVQVRK
jgi:putative methionine-R-sulfoxide reductase with GAF domain